MAQRRATGLVLRLGSMLVLGAVAACGSDTVERVTVSPGASMTEDSGADGGAQPPDGGDLRDAGQDADAAEDRDADACADDEACEVPVCGDGMRAGDEACDDGDIESGDGCDQLCEIESCTDGPRRDDGTCPPPAGGPECGNGSIEGAAGEECEPALALEGTCDGLTCQRLPACGNGEIEPDVGEQCDPSDGITCVSCRAVDPMTGPDAGVDGGVTCEPLPVPVVSITNGTFDTDVTGWMPRARITTSRGGEGATHAGSMRMAFEALAGGDGGYEVSGAYQCVFVPPGAAYVLSLQYQIPATASSELSATLMLRAYENADCSGASVPVAAPVLGGARGAWTAREGMISIGAEAKALFVQLSIVKPRNVEGVVLWDDLALRSDEDGVRCGDCEVDEGQGETCDDGNRAPGDGCDADCQLEGCGDGLVNGSEACDDGAQLFGDSSDTCTPACRIKSGCDTCAQTSCSLEVDPCLSLMGKANGGPRAGAARAALCDELRACVRATGCAGNTAIAASNGTGAYLEHCYCGNGGEDCFDGAANGSCRAEVEAALETTNPVTILSRVGGAQAQFPIFAALKDLLACEDTSCATSCVTVPECGDGIVQDRTAEFTESYKFRVGATLLACDDALTHTGNGCSFEECDDHDTEGGDGCDEHCFIEECGNNLTQRDEECDDGNRVSGDGCDADCNAEFECGDGTREAPFEECDPPGIGPVCTQAQYGANPSQCGCDEQCLYKVCGNGVLQDGEECDPPGPACSETCALLEDECTSCIRRVDPANGGVCGGAPWLEGDSSFPAFSAGCLNDAACYALWTCFQATQCTVTSDFYKCYCGDVPADECERSTYVPVGPCKDQMADAFEAQFQYPPQSNSEILDKYSDPSVPPGGYASYFIANDLAQFCLVPDGRGEPLRGILGANGLSAAEAQSCIDACFPDP